MDNTVAIKPKKAVDKFFSTNEIDHYRIVEMKKRVVEFISVCRQAGELVNREPNRKAEVVSHMETQRDRLLHDYYGNNGNGEKAQVKEFLNQVINNRGRLYEIRRGK
ncbi:MAG: hypothetical protein Q7S53_03285 [bacterium]|nr:hypothetical protein [bacterium]